jgi:preprotein translocase subunit SecG
MNVLFNLIVVVQVVSALAIIGLVLVQHGKGADMGAAFGSGASGSLFGASGSSNFLSKSTAVAAAIFFASTLGLAYFGTSRPHASVGGGVMEHVTVPVNKAPAGAGDAVPATVPAPAAPAPAAPAATQDVPAAAPAQAPAAPAAPAAAPAQAPAPAPAK